MTATYTKLKSGEWGIRVSGGTVRSGDRVTVAKKSGEVKTETVARVVWSGNGVTLCSVAPSGRSGGVVTERQADAGYGRGRQVRSDCCGYPCPVTGRRCTPSDPCHDCQ